MLSFIVVTLLALQTLDVIATAIILIVWVIILSNNRIYFIGPGNSIHI